jgi:hypothetical protein
MTGLSRATINTLESGKKDLGLAKVLAILEVLGMKLALDDASTGWSLLAEVLVPSPVIAQAIKTGRVPGGYSPEFSRMLELAPASELVQAVAQAFQGTVPRAAWEILAGLARASVKQPRGFFTKPASS